MKVKDGVSFCGLNIRMLPVLRICDRIWRAYGFELVVTSGTESNGGHMAGSLHWFGYALDFRTTGHQGWSIDIQDKIVEKLRKELPADYDMVVHDDHIHIEYNKAKEHL